MDRTPITAEQVRAQYAKNLAQLTAMLEAARLAAPKRYRGYTVAELETAVARYTLLAKGR